jgi:HEAT repeat protein
MVNDTDPDGVSALIRLTGDPDDEVRDWATFSLAGLAAPDLEMPEALSRPDPAAPDPEVLEALRARATDPHYDTRCEALAGLAKLRDASIVELVRADLLSDCVGTLVVEAAADLGDRSLLDPLIALREWWDVDIPLVEEAIGACQGQPR